MTSPDRLILHATAVSVAGQGVLLRGPSGSGKSELALQMMALGADLVADDQVVLTREVDGVRMSAPASIAGMIEARGLGLLNARAVDHANLTLVVEMGVRENQRLPPQRSIAILEQSVPLVHKVETPSFPAALLQYLKAGRKDADA